MNLKSMAVDKLVTLRAQVEAALSAKVSKERRQLEAELASLSRFRNGPRGSLGRQGSRVAPKYRNPDNPHETWAGRGLRPRWLAAALKRGKKIDEFLIATPAKTVSPKKAKARKRKAGK
jgi:DNA-binding protein H-NS